MVGNLQFAIFKQAVCQKCRTEHGINNDDEILTLQCKTCNKLIHQMRERILEGIDRCYDKCYDEAGFKMGEKNEGRDEFDEKFNDNLKKILQDLAKNNPVY
jgi:protein-arginine kinase activator protein McsA